MKSLCTCAALAVAAAFAQHQFADAMLRSNAISVRQQKVSGSDFEKLVDLTQCVKKINDFRDSLNPSAEDYLEDSGADGSTDLTDVEDILECEKLSQGKFQHISKNGQLFMTTASKGDAEEMTCDLALEQWKAGFNDFGKKHPPAFEDYKEVVAREENVYNNPNAVGLFSLLQKEAKTLACGTFSTCTPKFLFCYFKNTQFAKGAKVDPELWRALEVQQKVKPGLAPKGKDESEYLKAVNDVRAAEGLSLGAFTNPLNSSKLKRRSNRQADKEALDEAIKKYLYQLTCDDINNSNIKPAAKDQDYTVIYYIKEGAEAPDLAQAVAHWQTGFAKLDYKIPPVFKLESMNDSAAVPADAADPAVEASKIYKDSAVAGFVSIMAQEPRQMACVEATGCDDTKAALICFLYTATLVDGAQPLSQDLWTKIMKKEGYTLPQFTQLESGKNCLEEMNAVRTQEKLGLKPFLATVAKSTALTSLSAVMQSVTCEAMDNTTAKSTQSTGPKITITDGTTSLMYHTGTEGTCSEAVEAFKKGYEKFSSAPPAYKSDLAVYQDPAATNFVSLISDGENTTATCYSTSCAKKSIVCELSPAVLKESEKPVSEATFKKYTEIVKPPETSGAAGSSRAALIGTVVMAIAAAVFFF